MSIRTGGIGLLVLLLVQIYFGALVAGLRAGMPSAACTMTAAATRAAPAKTGPGLPSLATLNMDECH
jgi:heme A synthase